MSISHIEVQHLYKCFRTQPSVWVIDDLNISVDSGEIVCLVGPSGCGKTTLLKIVAGLIPPTKGSVVIRGALSSGILPEAVLIHQEFGRSLFPWLTVVQNVEFGIPTLGSTTRTRRARASALMDIVGVSEFASYYPYQLSGGMQQRVVLARALGRTPKLLLLDEAFGSLDALTKMVLLDEYLSLGDISRFSTLAVTHDVDEAIYVADKVYILSRRPARVVGVVRPNLPQPRDKIGTRTLPEFLRARNTVLEMLFSTPTP